MTDLMSTPPTPLAHILIIEDEPVIADSLIYALQTEGLAVCWVATGAAGLAHIEQTPPDLVILDIGLPDINGFDVCRKIRAQTNLPILFLTARHDEVDQVVALELGGDDYVSKPFSPRALTARVRALLRRSQGGELSGVTGSGFEIDAEARKARLHGRDLGLSRYEYGLFKLLLEHPRRVYSREQLLQQVWEYPEECLDRTVDTHIKTLRAKIRRIDARLDPIRTRRGEGYAYEP